MDIILYEPQIPQNTGNVIRTCKVTGSNLILVRPLGFVMNDKSLKRAGLDYHSEVNISYIDDLNTFLETTTRKFYFFTSKGTKKFTDAEFSNDNYLIFGSETSGIPLEIMHRWPDKMLRIPMIDKTRCLNLANTVAIGVYEALRQNQFIGLL